ncbi:MAG TPA: hypothetical protein PLX17_00580 [Chitinophagaceae bacterium]|nr:hypothetical protein [Chitinophagaceae bacterium]
MKDVQKWLRQAPKKSEIKEIQNGKDKVKIIPQKIIESLLDELTEQNWSTRNFQFNRFVETNLNRPAGTYNPESAGQRTMCDASLELVVTYKMVVPVSPYEPQFTSPNGPALKEIEITRVLVGAYSFDVSLFGNDHIANTAKSLCITNAASDLGRRFGKDLNPREAAIMILGMKKPMAMDTDHSVKVSEEAKTKIGESLDKIKDTLTKK